MDITLLLSLSALAVTGSQQDILFSLVPSLDKITETPYSIMQSNTTLPPIVVSKMNTQLAQCLTGTRSTDIFHYYTSGFLHCIAWCCMQFPVSVSTNCIYHISDLQGTRENKEEIQLHLQFYICYFINRS